MSNINVTVIIIRTELPLHYILCERLIGNFKKSVRLYIMCSLKQEEGEIFA